MASFLFSTALLFFLLICGQWIAFSLGLAGMAGLLIYSGTSAFKSIGPIAWNSVNNFVLVAIPLFIFMGEILLRSGLSGRFYGSLSLWLWKMPGGLLHSNIVGCAIFAGLTGSSPATAAAIGTVAVPELKKRGYEPKLVLGSLAAGGTLGILIPPSIIMILYGALVEQSVARLFAAGVLPGIVLTLLFMVYVAAKCMIQTELAPRENLVTSWRDLLRSLREILPLVALLLLIFGGIYFGLMTPTEAAGVGVGGTLCLGVAYRSLTWQGLWEATASTIRTTAMIVFIVIGASIFSFSLTNSGVDRSLTEWVVGLGLPKWAFFTILVALYVVLGCFMDGISILYLTVPVFFPILIQLGFDPIWFGVALVILIELSLITPPVGLNLFVIQAIARTTLREVAVGSLPFAVIMLVMIVIIALFPGLVLWLPNQMFGAG